MPATTQSRIFYVSICYPRIFNQNIQNYIILKSLQRCPTHIKGRTQAEGVQEVGAEEHSEAYKGRGNRASQKTA